MRPRASGDDDRRTALPLFFAGLLELRGWSATQWHALTLAVVDEHHIPARHGDVVEVSTLGGLANR